MLERIDHIVAVVPDLAAVGAAYEQLGLVLTPESRVESAGIANRVAFVGTNAANYSYLELIAVTDETTARETGREAYIETTARGGGAVGVAFGTADVASAAARLGVKVESLSRPDGTPLVDMAVAETAGNVPFRVSVSQYPESWTARFERSLAAGRFAHTFPLKRLDHLAAVAPDLEAATRYWGDKLGVPVFGEIRTPQLVIRQLKIGDAILELLGPAAADSPMASRPASLASMAAWEVSGSLDDAVSLAKERGFSPSEPEAGVIPGTRRATIPASELGGVGMQLLEYV